MNRPIKPKAEDSIPYLYINSLEIYVNKLELYCDELENELFFVKKQKQFVQQVRDEACFKLNELHNAFDEACALLEATIPWVQRSHIPDNVEPFGFGRLLKTKEEWKEYFLKDNEDEQGAEWLL